MTHIPYPSIEQFRTTIKRVTDRTRYAGRDENGDAIYNNLKPLPVLKYQGTIKLHGTNGAIIVDRLTKTLRFQSRERMISPGDDNAGFATAFYGKYDQLSEIVEHLKGNEIAIFGEWCCGSIQNGVALNQLSKRFVVFSLKIDGIWQLQDVVSTVKNQGANIYNIYDYPTWEIDIDFAAPEKSQNKLVDLVNEIEAECPFGKAHGVSGVGEGVVFKCITADWEAPQFWFKAKGAKHQSSHTKTIVPVDVEAVENIRAFADAVVTDSRCRQSIDKLKEAGGVIDRSRLGEFLKWIYGDVVKEETDTAVASGIELKKASGSISNKAREWFFKHELEF